MALWNVFAAEQTDFSQACGLKETGKGPRNNFASLAEQPLSVPGSQPCAPGVESSASLPLSVALSPLGNFTFRDVGGDALFPVEIVYKHAQDGNDPRLSSRGSKEFSGW